MPWTIELYEDENGYSNVKDYLGSFTDKKLLAKVLKDIELLREKGIELREPHVSNIGDGIWELRTIQSNNISRILYFTYTDQKFVLLNGFIKKKTKTPPGEIKKAKKYRDDYLRRNK